jgi:hypothetical protein
MQVPKLADAIHIDTCLSDYVYFGFRLLSRFIGASPVVTTNNCNTFKITVIITHKDFNSHVKSTQVFYELPVAVSYRELNSTQSHIGNDGQSVSQLWRQAPSWAHIATDGQSVG